jgi:hypothetical protein
MSNTKLTKRNTKRIMKGGRRNHKTLNKNKTKNKQKGGEGLKNFRNFYGKTLAGNAATTAVSAGTGALVGALGSGTAAAGAATGLSIGSAVGGVAAGVVGLAAGFKAIKEREKNLFHSRFYEEYMNEIEKKDRKKLNISEYSKLLPALGSEGLNAKKLSNILGYKGSDIKQKILETYNNEEIKKKMKPIVITKARPDNYIIRTTGQLMPIWNIIKNDVNFVNPLISDKTLISHHHYVLKNKNSLSELYGNFSEGEEIMPCSFMNPIHMRLKDYDIKSNDNKINVEEEIKRQIKGGDPKLLKSNVFNQSDFFVPEKYSPRGPWNELSLKNGKESIGDQQTSRFGRTGGTREAYSDWKKPESFYLGVNERDDWIFWAKIASIIDYKPPFHSQEQNDTNWWLNNGTTGIKRVELSWNDLLQQLPGFLPTSSKKEDGNDNLRINIPNILNKNNFSFSSDIDYVKKFYKNYIDYNISENIKTPESREGDNKDLTSFKRALLYRNSLTDAAWKLFKNSKGLIEKMKELDDTTDPSERKKKFREILNKDTICRIPGLFDRNEEKHTNILINKWYPYKNEMTTDEVFYTPILDEKINDIIDEESNEKQNKISEKKLDYMKKVHQKIVNDDSENMRKFKKDYDEYINKLIEKIDNFIKEDNRLLTGGEGGVTARDGQMPLNDTIIPDQKLCVRHHIYTKFPGDGPTKPYFNRIIDDPQIKQKIDSNKEIINQCRPKTQPGGLEEEEQTKIRIQIIKDLTDMVFQFYVNMERIMPRDDINDNVKETSNAYSSVYLLNGINDSPDLMKTAKNLKEERGKDTIGDVTKPMIFGGTADYHFVPTRNILYATRIKKDGMELADIKPDDIRIRNEPYNPFEIYPGNTPDISKDYLHHEITIDGKQGNFMTFAQLLDLYIFKLKKEFMSINEGEKIINKLRNKNLKNINPKLFWDLAYANKIINNYNKIFVDQNKEINKEKINEINKNNEITRIKIQERNIKTMDQTQELFNLIEARCPHCKNNSVDYTASTHQPEYKIDMLPHDNHQNGAWYFYCNHSGCNAFLGSMWREKSEIEMGPWSTIGFETRTDMPRNTLSAISLLSSVSDKDQHVHKVNTTDIFLENEYIKKLYYQDIFSNKLIEGKERNSRKNNNIISREDYEKIIEMETIKKKESIFTKDEQRSLFQNIYKLSSSKNKEEKEKNIEKINEILVNISAHPAFEEESDIQRIISDFVYKSIYNIVSLNYNEDFGKFQKIVGSIYNDISNEQSASLLKIDSKMLNTESPIGLRIETKKIEKQLLLSQIPVKIISINSESEREVPRKQVKPVGATPVNNYRPPPQQQVLTPSAPPPSEVMMHR